MYLLGIAVLLGLLKLADVEPVASWSWWVILGVFGATAAWWAWADMSGYTKRRAADKIEQRRLKRIERNKDAMGTGTRSRPRR
jgi:small Trp-rich protein